MEDQSLGGRHVQLEALRRQVVKPSPGVLIKVGRAFVVRLQVLMAWGRAVQSLVAAL